MENVKFSDNKWHDKELLFKSNKFIKWYEKVMKNFNVESIYVNDIRMFGNLVGFVYMTVFVKTNENKVIKREVFLRGESATILLVAIDKESEEKFTIFTYQPRVPVGAFIYEAPAGMTDENDSNFTALTELNEEVGTEFSYEADKLILLDAGYTSPGGMDEYMSIYAYEIALSADEIDMLNNKSTGLEDEDIVLKVIPLKDAIQVAESVVTKLAIHSYIFKEGL